MSGLAVISGVYLALLSPSLAMTDFEVQQGQLVSEAVTAPFGFEVPLSGDEMDALHDQTAIAVPFYLFYSDAVWPALAPRLESSLGICTDLRYFDSTFADNAIRDLSVFYDKGVFDLDEVRRLYAGDLAVLRRGDDSGSVTQIAGLNIHSLTEVSAAFSSTLRGGGLPAGMADTIASSLTPNVLPDEPRRESAILEQLSVINPVDTVLAAGDTIIPAGGIVTERTVRYIEALRSAQAQGVAGRRFRYTLGRLLLLAGILALAVLYTRDSMPEAWKSTSRLLLLCTTWSVTVAATGLSWLVLGQLYSGSFATFATFGAVHTSVFFRRRDAAVYTFLFAMLSALGQPHPYCSMMVTSVSGVLAAYLVWDLRRRSSIPKSILFSALGGTLALVLCRLLDIGLAGTPLWTSALETLLSPVAGIGAATALLFSFEKIFGVSTLLSIEEVRNRNHPLLLELSKWAMGTWQHSQHVADLASEAARAIDANSGLAEAGGLFHDIGKVRDPRHFIENLAPGSPNPHDELHPVESVRKVIAHVAEGRRLARKFRVPPPVADIIGEHHGTTIMKVFLEKARNQAADGAEVDPDDFRYPGPRPRSREAAIVMLADAVESATKNLDASSADSLPEIIREIIEDRDSDGQLDDCHITRGNLRTIQEAFLKVLRGRFHERVKDYPHGSGTER